MTDKNLPNSDYDYPPQYPEDEIELIDLLRVVWKWRYLIIGGTLLCVVVAGAVSLLMPKVYRGSILIDSGVAAKSLEGKTTYLVDPGELKTVIESGALDNEIVQAVREGNVTRVSEGLSFDAEVRKGTNLVEVSCEAGSPDLVAELLRQMYQQIKEKYADKLAYHQENYKERQLQLAGELERLKDEIAVKKELLSSLPVKMKAEEKEYARRLLVVNKQQSLHEKAKSRLNGRIGEIEDQIETVLREIDVLTDRRENSLKTQEQNFPLATVLLRDTIQEMREHLNSLRNQLLGLEENVQQAQMDLYDLEDKVENVKALKNEFVDQMEKQKIALAEDIRKMELEIASTEKEVRWGKKEKEDIQNISLVKPPEGAKDPVKPKMSMNIVLAGVAGVFIMLFLAFFLEYLQKNRNRLE